MVDPALAILALGWLVSKAGAPSGARRRRSHVPSPPEHWREPARSPFPAKRRPPPGRHDTSAHRRPVAAPEAPRETPRGPKVPLTAPQPKEAPESAVITRSTVREHGPLVSTQPAPWPAERPKDLGVFPGPDWQADTPLRPEVVARAGQLLRELHSRGVGSHVVEHLGGRWIAFVAKMHGSKRAVEAFRKRSEPAAPRAVNVSTRVATPTERNLGLGSSGDDVAALQRTLGGLKVDGKFGPKTEAAVKEYQAANGLKSDGIVGPKTKAVLPSNLPPVELETPAPVVTVSPVPVAPATAPGEGTAPVGRVPSTVRKGSIGEDVMLLQRTLGGLEVDGKFGPKTDTAVREYQTAKGLKRDGIVGPKTWASLLGGSA
jgi:peptidoglycan hydrolase-like protein with peptidoglycan-binding domain